MYSADRNVCFRHGGDKGERFFLVPRRAHRETSTPEYRAGVRTIDLQRTHLYRPHVTIIIICTENGYDFVFLILFYQAENKGATATEYGLVFGVFELVVFLISPVYGKHVSVQYIRHISF